MCSPKLKFQTAKQLKEIDKLNLGCPKLDTILKGGFETKVLNEIVGCSGSGKTQICLVLSLMVQLPKKFGGFNKAAVYICTEDVFPVKRLHQLNCCFQEKYGMTTNFLDNIFIQHIPDYKLLRHCLCTHLSSLVKVKDVGLIVIDSIAGIFRSDNVDTSYVDRSKKFSEIALILREFGSKYCSVIICVNQMTDDLNSGKTEPCLGLSWSNLVVSRFFIGRSYPSSKRTFQVVFSPYLSNSECDFFITEEGIVADI